MATLRKANSYSKIYKRPYTRTSRKKNKSYIKVVPAQKVVKFHMGNQKLVREGKLNHHLTMVTDEYIQIRSNSLESARQYIVKQMDIALNGQYYFRVVPFPHHIQRENKMLTGAGADRLSKGMQLSFGRSICRVALLKKGERLFEIHVADEKAVQKVREFLKAIKAKIPCSTKVLYEKIASQ